MKILSTDGDNCLGSLYELAGEEINGLSLSIMLGKHKVKDIVTIVRAIPKNILFLEIPKIDKTLSVDDLVLIFNNLPAVQLALSVELTKLSTEQLAALFSAISTKIEKIRIPLINIPLNKLPKHIQCVEIFLLTGQDSDYELFIPLISQIPSTVSVLSITTQFAHTFDKEKVIAAIPKHITAFSPRSLFSLSLLLDSPEFLNRLEKLAVYVDRLPNNFDFKNFFSHLANLKSFAFSSLTRSRTVEQMYSHLPNSTTEVACSLDSSIKQLQFLPKQIKTLKFFIAPTNLNSQILENLAVLSTQHLLSVREFAYAPSSFKNLDSKTIQFLIQNAPVNTEILSLNGCFYPRHFEALCTWLPNLSKKIKILDLGNNYFHTLTYHQFWTLISAIPSHVKGIRLGPYFLDQCSRQTQAQIVCALALRFPEEMDGPDAIRYATTGQLNFLLNFLYPDLIELIAKYLSPQEFNLVTLSENIICSDLDHWVTCNKNVKGLPSAIAQDIAVVFTLARYSTDILFWGQYLLSCLQGETGFLDHFKQQKSNSTACLVKTSQALRHFNKNKSTFFSTSHLEQAIEISEPLSGNKRKLDEIEVEEQVVQKKLSPSS